LPTTNLVVTRSHGEDTCVRGGQSGQNLFELDGTRLGLLLLHVGPNSDEFGGQACMEHYTGPVSCTSSSVSSVSM
jgi:hypothetical protein